MQRSRLSASRRVRRGFTRLGFAIAALTLVVGVGITGMTSLDAAAYAQRSQQNAACLKAARAAGKFHYEQYSPHIIDAGTSGCPSAPSVTVEELYRIDTDKAVYLPSLFQNAVAGLSLVLALVAGAFLLPWGFGWILSGFFQD